MLFDPELYHVMYGSRDERWRTRRRIWSALVVAVLVLIAACLETAYKQ